MYQIAFDRYGGPDVLKLRQMTRPAAGAGEVGIAVNCSGVNFADVMARMGLYPDAPKPPLVPGYEVTGVVDSVGAGVTHLREGDRVVALTRFGGYSSHVVVPGSYAFAVPSSISDASAAALPVNYLTASLALYDLANLAEGQTVLIHGAGGGVGIAAMQLAKLRSARVIGTASVSKHKALRAMGIDYLVDSRKPLTEIAHEVRRATNDRGPDVVLDPVGGRSFETSYRLLAPLGRLVIYGVSAIAPGQRRNWFRAAKAIFQMGSFKPVSLMNRNKGVFGLNLAHLWDEREKLSAVMQDLLTDLSAGRLRPCVAQTFSLEQAADAHRFIQARANIGKVILTVGRSA